MDFTRWHKFKEITAVTTKRYLGHSKAPYDGANLAFHVGDDPIAVKHNREALLKDLGLTKDHIVLTYQSHSDIVKRVTLSDGGAGYDSFESGIAADALYTYDTGVALAVFHADCAPVFLYDEVKKWVAVIHAGTPGTLNRITEKTVRHLINTEGSDPKNIYAYIGPALTFAFHPIAETEKESVLKANPDFNYGVKRSDGLYYLDVPLLNYGQLRALGIPSINIEASGIDTYSNPNEYFSFARDKKTGRHLSIIIKNR